MLPPDLASNQAFLSPARSALSVSSENIWIAGKQCDLVSLRVAKVANIKMRPAHITKARLTLVKTTCGKRGGVKVTNLLLTARLKRDHSAVPSRGRMSIEGWFDVEIR